MDPKLPSCSMDKGQMVTIGVLCSRPLQHGKEKKVVTTSKEQEFIRSMEEPLCTNPIMVCVSIPMHSQRSTFSPPFLHPASSKPESLVVFSRCFSPGGVETLIGHGRTKGPQAPAEEARRLTRPLVRSYRACGVRTGILRSGKTKELIGFGWFWEKEISKLLAASNWCQ